MATMKMAQRSHNSPYATTGPATGSGAGSRRCLTAGARHIRRPPPARASADAKQNISAGNDTALEEAYEYCRAMTESFAKTFYFATAFQPKDKAQSIYAIYAWCRTLDETIDSAAAQAKTDAELVAELDDVQQRLEGLWQGDLGPQGAPAAQPADVALMDTIRRTPGLEPQPFLDMVQGMRMDVSESVRYQTFEQLFLYCYRVAGTVGLMTIPVLGTAPEADFDQAAAPGVALGVALQLTNIIRDVGEDIDRGRLYLPSEDLQEFGVTEDDVKAKVVTENYKYLIEFEIQRALAYYDQAASGVPTLAQSSRLPVLAALLLYRRILEGVRDNDYNNLTLRSYTSKAQKVAALPGIWAQAVAGSKPSGLEGYWLDLPDPRRRLINKLLAATALEMESEVAEVVEALCEHSPTRKPALSESLAGDWELLWSSPGSDYSRLRKKLAGGAVQVPSSSSQVITETESQNIVTVGPATVVISATIEPDSGDDAGIRTLVGPPYTFTLGVGPLRLPLEFPPEFSEERTCVETLYVDERLKISRVGPYGERTTPGSIFIHARRAN